MVGIWVGRLKALKDAGGVNRERAAEEGAKAAAHVMTMVIRSLDYAPAVEVEFEDILEAILVGDEYVAPDDEHNYRGALLASFERYGIHRPDGRIVDVASEGLPLRYDNINALALRSSKQEAYRFLWQNLDLLELKSDWYLQIEALKPALRVGPDGLVVQEVVCDYVQILELTAGQARDLAASAHDEDPEGSNQLLVPGGLEATVPLQFWGGGTLIFDQFGRAKLHQRKSLNDWSRQSDRLEYLLRKGRVDTRGRLGFSTGTSLGMAFADLHAPDYSAGEAW
jgi:hypothetical protein